jgi:hypothetical protein
MVITVRITQIQILSVIKFFRWPGSCYRTCMYKPLEHIFLKQGRFHRQVERLGRYLPCSVPRENYFQTYIAAFRLLPQCSSELHSSGMLCGNRLSSNVGNWLEPVLHSTKEEQRPLSWRINWVGISPTFLPDGRNGCCERFIQLPDQYL